MIKKLEYLLALLVLMPAIFGLLTDGLNQHWPFQQNLTDVYRGRNWSSGPITNTTIITATGVNGNTHNFTRGQYRTNKTEVLRSNNYTVIWYAKTFNCTDAENNMQWFGDANQFGGGVRCIQNYYSVWIGNGTWIDNMAQYTPNQWECHAMRFNVSRTEYFLNGKPRCDFCGASLPLGSQNEVGNITNGGTYMNHTLDEVAVYSEALTNDTIAQYCDNTSFYPNFGAIPTVNITRVSYNVTSAYANQTAWRTNVSFPVPTLDNTPTVTFTTVNAGNCSISLFNFNYSDMTSNDTETKCGTTDTTSMTCTLPASKQLAVGQQNLYITCGGAGYNETTNATSGGLNILYNATRSFNFSFADGLNKTRIDQNFRPNWSIMKTIINFSNNVTMQFGNYSFNLTQYNVTTNATFVLNFTNNGLLNSTIVARLNGTNPRIFVWAWLNATIRYNLTNASTYLALFNLTANQTRLINITIDILNISQTYSNFTLYQNNTDMSFNVTFNATASG